MIKPEELKLTKSLADNVALFKSVFANDQTMIYREFQNKHLAAAKCCIIYVDGMVNTELVNENIIRPILANYLDEDIAEHNLLTELQYKVIQANNLSETADILHLLGSVTYGETIFLLEGYDTALIIDTKGWPTRSVDEPKTERGVQGPREGFSESMIVNVSLLRRKLRSSDLKFQYKELGTRTRTSCCIVYLEGIASEKVIQELNTRLDKINIDGILSSGMIQELIKDSPYSIFETVGNTERPDVLAAKLLDGRIGLIVDGTPFVLTVPFVVLEYFQVNEDYYQNFIFASINRLLRIIGALFSISVPAFYIALTTYNQETIPTPLLLSISAAREGVPFPTMVEALIMLLVFEILREAGTRMPENIGQAVSIVGALVLGQAAVEARLISAPMVIVTALTGIASLLLASFISISIVLRTIFLLLAAFMGLYGWMFGLVGLVIYLMGMRSFGVPYMLNVMAIREQDVKDTIIRAPWWLMITRPRLIGSRNFIRQSPKRKQG